MSIFQFCFCLLLGNTLYCSTLKESFCFRKYWCLNLCSLSNNVTYSVKVWPVPPWRQPTRAKPVQGPPARIFNWTWIHRVFCFCSAWRIMEMMSFIARPRQCHNAMQCMHMNSKMRQVGQVRRIIVYCLSIYYIMTKKQKCTSNVSTYMCIVYGWMSGWPLTSQKR